MDPVTYTTLAVLTAIIIFGTRYALRIVHNRRIRKALAALRLIAIVGGIILLANAQYVSETEVVYVDTAFIVPAGANVEVTLVAQGVAVIKSNVTHAAFELKIIRSDVNVTLVETDAFTYVLIANADSYTITLRIATGKPVLFQLLNAYLAYVKTYRVVFRAGIAIIGLALLFAMYTLAKEKKAQRRR